MKNEHHLPSVSIGNPAKRYGAYQCTSHAYDHDGCGCSGKLFMDNVRFTHPLGNVLAKCCYIWVYSLVVLDAVECFDTAKECDLLDVVCDAISLALKV